VLLIALLSALGIHMVFAASMPGALISMTALPGAPDGASAYRVLYTSTDLSGDMIPVSGVVIVPKGPAPPGGRPIVAWAHPTTGIVCRCAPSLARVFFASVQGLNAMLAHGYIVAATDYPGLGTPEVHPYLVGISEGRAVLDSVRAAQQIPGADASHVFAVWGHSQGGHATLYAGLLTKQYAPELKLAGVAVAAPATDLATLMTDDLGTGGGNNITAMTLWSWSRIYNVPISQVVTPAGAAAIDRLASECIERWFDILIRRSPTTALKKSFLRVHDLAAIEPWHQLLVQNTPGPLPPDVPVFVAQGSGDRLVQPAVTVAYVHALCRDGSKVEFDLLPGVGHAFIARDSANAAITWITARFNGKSAPTDCNHLVP
jgi:acetyl esterase/lipase